MTRDQNSAEIRALADRVIAIAPNGIDSLIWQGWLAYVDNDNHLAAQFYEKAIAIDSANVDLLRVVGVFLGEIGQPEEAIKLGEFLKLRDPSWISHLRSNLIHVGPGCCKNIISTLSQLSPSIFISRHRQIICDEWPSRSTLSYRSMIDLYG